MFREPLRREPLRRDPLVVGWAVVLLLAGFVALSNNTEWSGHLEAERVAGFLKDLAEAFLWSFFLLLLLAWVRAKGWFGDPGAPAPRHAKPERPASSLPWTDRWLRDSREQAARTRTVDDGEPELVACRHGVPVGPAAEGQMPVLRALSVSHTIVRPGSSVLVTWCFEHARDVLVDGHGGHPRCGEALVRIDSSRRVDVTGRNRFTTTPAATPVIAAVAVPQLDLPSVAAPPLVSLRADVAATVGAPSPVTQRLDAFWATQDALRPQLEVSPRFVGVPESLVQSLRRAEPKDHQ
ncbi:hypothetical protein SAMN05660657_02314 [Geodermatophilus amargosae]|uniref:Uncharacterized protein n=1 Tax=Geodermatophilus amargosae TaxID=1296565 RepID=A0A1I6ZWU8_9ACTN|nr:hypothetical protein [Geodermatophilus amargosae]SFT67159.1 hypothetical protein SAMN05660657_02314 [Geodermatophilus amargosae]